MIIVMIIVMIITMKETEIITWKYYTLMVQEDWLESGVQVEEFVE